jgi:hypothetical protein
MSGTGAQVLLYDLITAELLCSKNIFEGVRVHGIYCGPAFGKEKDTSTSESAFRIGSVVIHGERKVKLFKMIWHFEEETPELHSLCSLPRFSYWVMDVRIIQVALGVLKYLRCVAASLHRVIYLICTCRSVHRNFWSLELHCIFLHVVFLSICFLKPVGLTSDVCLFGEMLSRREHHQNISLQLTLRIHIFWQLA